MQKKKISKTVGLPRKVQATLSRTFLIAIYKSFVRAHLDYGILVYDQTFNESFHQSFESTQYNAVITITEAIRGTSSKKLYQELSLESLR